MRLSDDDIQAMLSRAKEENLGPSVEQESALWAQIERSVDMVETQGDSDLEPDFDVSQPGGAGLAEVGSTMSFGSFAPILVIGGLLTTAGGYWLGTQSVEHNVKDSVKAPVDVLSGPIETYSKDFEDNEDTADKTVTKKPDLEKPAVVKVSPSKKAPIVPAPKKNMPNAKLERPYLEEAISHGLRGDYLRSSALLKTYLREYPTGALREEGRALYVDALFNAGRVSGAKTEAISFVLRYPSSIFLESVSPALDVDLP